MRTLVLFFLLTSVLFADECPDGYLTLYPGKCIRIYTDQVLSFADAEALCFRDGGHLVSIHSEEENNMYYAYLQTVPYGIWIGMFSPKEGGEHWMDGSADDYDNTAPDSDCTFNNGHGHRDSGFVMIVEPNDLVRGGQWECVSAALTARAMCQITGNFQPPPPTPELPPTGICGTDDDSYDFYDETSSCLKVHSERQSFKNAETTCTREGAHLVSIHNRATNDFIRRLSLTNRFLDGVLIGLKLDLDYPEWTDGSDNDFSNYNPGMPNSLFGECTALETIDISGPWTNVDCNYAQLPFICAKPAQKNLTSSLCPQINSFTISGTVNSPAYPNLQDGGFSCEYFFAVNPHDHVLITFPEFRIVDGDYIELYDGADTHVPFQIITRIIDNEQFQSADTNVIRMVFKVSDARGRRVWQAVFQGI